MPPVQAEESVVKQLQIRCLVAVVLWNWIPVARAQVAPEVPPPNSEAAVASRGSVSEIDAPTADDIARALERYRHEPDVGDVVTAAVAAQRTNPGRVAALASRARTAGWLPTVRLSARRGQTIDLLAAQTTTTDRNSASSGDDFVLEAQLSIDLAKVVWSNNELRVEREMRAERKAEQEIVVLVTQLYFERRRLQLERDLGGATAITEELRILELEGLLDALTAGAFRRSLERHAH
jgi:hypothetical protein